jgi:hypothetical protein
VPAKEVEISPGEYLNIRQVDSYGNEGNHYSLKYGKYTSFELGKFGDRIKEILEVHEALKAQIESITDGAAIIEVDLVTLCDCIGLYINDIKEHSSLHNSRGPSSWRRAALIARHVSNLRPLRVKIRIAETDEDLAQYVDYANATSVTLDDTVPGIDELLRHANEHFAARIAFHYIGFSMVLLNDDEILAIFDTLLFIFTYRDPSKELLIGLVRALKLISSLKDH